MTTLASRGETVLLDRLSHASLIDGGLLSGARFKRFAHADVHAAESALAAHAKSAVVVAKMVFLAWMVTSDRFQRLLASVDRTMHGWSSMIHGLGVIGATGAAPWNISVWTQKLCPVPRGHVGQGVRIHLVRLSPARLS